MVARVWLNVCVCVGVLHIRFAILSNIIRIYLCHLNNTWKQKHTFVVRSFFRSFRLFVCSFVRNDDVQMPHNGRPVSSSSSSVTTTTFSSEHLAREFVTVDGVCVSHISFIFIVFGLLDRHRLHTDFHSISRILSIDAAHIQRIYIYMIIIVIMIIFIVVREPVQAIDRIRVNTEQR